MKFFTSTLFFYLLLFVPFSVAYTEVETAYGDSGINDAKEKTTDWGRCSALQHAHKTALPYSKITQQPHPDAIYLEADTGIIRREATSTLRGNIIIQKNGILFNANHARFNKNSHIVTTNGNVILVAPELVFQAQSIQYNLKNHTGVVKQATYKVGKLDARGKSQEIELVSQNEIKLKQATFTSCPTPKPSWHIKSSEIHINKKTQQGSAKNVTFNVKGVPVFYFPTFNFPLNNNRKSGFLTPSARIQSNTGISLPYYFNLAPNYDATVTTILNKRQGFMFDTELRYLTPLHKGNFEYNFIPEDKSFNDTSDNKYRDYFKLEHHTTLSKNTQINLNAEGVSDKDYFDDLSDSLETSARSSLQRRLEITHINKPWTFSAALEAYQILDTDNLPYSRLPELKLSYKPKTSPKKLKIGLEVELVNFDKKNALTGTRLDSKVFVSKKWGNDAWFIKPTLSLQSTLYTLNNTIGKSTLNRTLPTFTLDSGLFFDRDITIHKKSGDKHYTQTLEPHLFYSYTPFKNQSNFPVFDTARTHYSASTQLFSENRFTGKDRIADTNRLAFVVGSRLHDRKNGKELFKASMGQVFNFNDRKVTLPGGTIQTGQKSDLMLELSGRINDNFRVTSSALWNLDKKRITNTELRLNYQDDKRRIANISYRKLNTELNTTDSESSQLTLSGALPLNNQWSFVGSMERDLENKRNLETLAGFEYQDCCWKTRLVAKRYLSADNVNYETPVFIEFELKGIGGLGNGARRELKDKIYGYDDY